MPKSNARFRTVMLLGFWPLTALVLYCDSRQVAGFTSYGQAISTVLAFGFLLALLACVRPERRLALALFVVLSAIGEGVFSLLFGLYHYRLGGVPLYVPLGHSILMGTGLLLADLDWVKQRLSGVKTALLLMHGGLILGTLLLFGDTLSTFWTVIFLFLLRKRFADPFYLILGALVLYVEMLGTAWGCWVWRPDAFGVLHTTNPPPGAFTCYVVGDILALSIARRVQAGWAKVKANRLSRRSESPATV